MNIFGISKSVYKLGDKSWIRVFGIKARRPGAENTFKLQKSEECIAHSSKKFDEKNKREGSNLREIGVERFSSYPLSQ